MVSEKELYIYTGKELLKDLKVNKLKYIITGCGRSGTVYMAKLFSSIGIPCGHESIFDCKGIETAKNRVEGVEPTSISHIGKLASECEEKEGICWFGDKEIKLVADSSYMAAPFLDDPYFRDAVIIHVFRHPMKVISSFINGLKYFKDECIEDDLKEYHQFIYKYIPGMKDVKDSISRAALYWVEWNRMIKQKSENRIYFRYKVEDNPNKLLDFLSVKSKKYYHNTKSNHVETKKVYRNFKEIPDLDIRAKTIKLYNSIYLPDALL
jgi:hypothetical protein